MRHAMAHAMRRAAAAMVILAAGACGDSTGPSGPGSGTVNATGAVTASGSGVALFQSTTSGTTGLFQMLIASPTGEWQVQLVDYTGRPAVGTYQLLPLGDADQTASFYHGTTAGITMYNATSGELVITSSTSSAVKGTYRFTAQDVDGTATVTAQGSFDARCAPGTVCS